MHRSTRKFLQQRVDAYDGSTLFGAVSSFKEMTIADFLERTKDDLPGESLMEINGDLDDLKQRYKIDAKVYNILAQED